MNSLLLTRKVYNEIMAAREGNRYPVSNHLMKMLFHVWIHDDDGIELLKDRTSGAVWCNEDGWNRRVEV